MRYIKLRHELAIFATARDFTSVFVPGDISDVAAPAFDLGTTVFPRIPHGSRSVFGHVYIGYRDGQRGKYLPKSM